MGWRAVDVRGARHLFGQLNSRRAKPRQVVEVEQEEAVGFAAAVAASVKITFPCGPFASGACPLQRPADRLELKVDLLVSSEYQVGVLRLYLPREALGARVLV